MEIVAEAEIGDLPLVRYAHVMRRTFPEVLQRGARGVVRRVLAITPPAEGPNANQTGTLGNDSKVRGNRAIERDIRRIFVPVRLKGKRKEKLVDLAQVHRIGLLNKRPGKQMRRHFMTPFGSTPLWVDVRKYNQLATDLRSHVGRLAAGWVPAAQALGVSTPAWVTRHGAGRGTFKAEYDSELLYISAVNLASRFAPADELRRRIPYALQYQANAMHREMQHLLIKRARECGFVAAG